MPPKDTRRCFRCKQQRPRLAYDGGSTVCCHCVAIRPLITSTDKVMAKRARDGFYQRSKAWYRDFMKDRTCAMCGNSESLEWHHRDPSAKSYEVGRMVKPLGPRVLKEVEKCDLLCHSCHRSAHKAMRST